MSVALSQEERKERIAALRPWILSLQAPMGLAHWRIRVVDDPPQTANAFAEFAQWVNAREADIHIGDQFFTTGREEQRETIVHEYLHGHMKLFKHLFADMENYLSKVMWDHMNAQFFHAEEMTVDALSRIVAVHLSLPPELPATEGATKEKPIVDANLY